jgi:CRISPR/Cas system-associated exonuclease Cas4 (RecB family)
MRTLTEKLIIGSDTNDAGRFDPRKRNKYLNSSEALSCIRRQWYQKHGAKEEPQDWGFARRGTHGEKFLVDSLLAANVPLRYTGKYQLSLQDEKRKISSTPDGVIEYDDEWIVPEFKTIDPRTNKSNLPRVGHVAQLEIAMEMIDQHIDRPDGVGLSGVLIYMDASNYHDLIEVPVPRNRAILDKMARRSSKILRTKDVRNLDREGRRDGGNECKMCPFRETCGVHLEAGQPKRANRSSNFDVAALRYMELKDLEDAIKTEKAGLSEDIKRGLRQRGTNKAVVGGINVTLSVTKGRASLDRKAVKAAGIDLSPFETTGNPSERLLVDRA